MSTPEHPENFRETGPTNLDPKSIEDEIASVRSSITYSNCIGVLVSTLYATRVLPGLVEAGSNMDVGRMAENGFLATVTIGAIGFVSANRHAYKDRLMQARYNRQLNRIAAADQTPPSC